MKKIKRFVIKLFSIPIFKGFVIIRIKCTYAIILHFMQHWLDPSTRISRQLKSSIDTYDMYFGVKFYAADPTKLIEEITR